MSTDILDYWTNISLESIWKAQVAQCIEASNTGNTIQNETSQNDKDWELINKTIIAEPFWGQVVNRN